MTHVAGAQNPGGEPGNSPNDSGRARIPDSGAPIGRNDPIFLDVDPTDVIELQFPARPDQLVLARLVTGAIAAQVGFDVEEIDDLKLAVDELCVSSMGSATRGTLHLRFTAGDSDIHITCTFSPEFEGTAPDAEAPAARAKDAVPPAHAHRRPPAESIGALSSFSTEFSEKILGALVDEYGRNGNGPGSTTWLNKRRRDAVPPGTAR